MCRKKVSLASSKGSKMNNLLESISTIKKTKTEVLYILPKSWIKNLTSLFAF